MNNLFYYSHNILGQYPIEALKAHIVDSLEQFNTIDIMQGGNNGIWTKDDGCWVIYFLFYPSCQKPSSIAFKITVTQIDSLLSHTSVFSMRADKAENKLIQDIDAESLLSNRKELDSLFAVFSKTVDDKFAERNFFAKNYGKEVLDEYEESNPIASIILIVAAIIIAGLSIALGLVFGF